MSTVQDALGDVDGLHSKLDRKRHVESSNQAVNIKFQEDFCSEVSTMKAGLDSFATTQQKLCTNFSNRIGKASCDRFLGRGGGGIHALFFFVCNSCSLPMYIL